MRKRSATSRQTAFQSLRFFRAAWTWKGQRRSRRRPEMGKDAGPILRYCQCGAQSAGGAGRLLSLRICGIRRSISALRFLLSPCRNRNRSHASGVFSFLKLRKARTRNRKDISPSTIYVLRGVEGRWGRCGEVQRKQMIHSS